MKNLKFYIVMQIRLVLYEYEYAGEIKNSLLVYAKPVGTR